MNILVTGGSGFIGSHVVDALALAGYRTVIIDIKPPHREDIEFINGSILDKKLVEYLVNKADVIFHIGGFSNINFVKENPVETIELNVLSTVYLLDACRKKKDSTHFVYASSVYAFDRTGHLYTTSKASSERIIEDFSILYRIPFSILRYGTVYGPRNREADVVYHFIKQAKNGGPISIHGNGMQKRNFTHVKDIAEASIKVIGNNKAKNRIFTIANPESTSIVELANKVKSIVNPNITLEFQGEEREEDYCGVVKDIEIAETDLNWKCKVSLGKGIEELKLILDTKIGN